MTTSKKMGLIDLSLRVAQLVVSIIALALGISAYYFNNPALLLITLIAIASVAILAFRDQEKNSWYGRLNALNALRLQVEFSTEPIKGTLRTTYRSLLETNYHYALLEDRTELAKSLKEKLDRLN